MLAELLVSEPGAGLSVTYDDRNSLPVKMSQLNSQFPETGKPACIFLGVIASGKACPTPPAKSNMVMGLPGFSSIQALHTVL